MQDVISQQIRRVQNAVSSKVITKRALARAAGIRDTVLIRMDGPAWNPQADTLKKLVRVLDEMSYPDRPRRRGEGNGLAA